MSNIISDEVQKAIAAEVAKTLAATLPAAITAAVTELAKAEPDVLKSDEWPSGVPRYTGTVPDTTITKACSKAQDLAIAMVEKSNFTMTMHKALSTVWKKHPTLYAQHRAETARKRGDPRYQ